jgi:hypothetical protein
MIAKNHEDMSRLREQVYAIKLKQRETVEKYGIDAVVEFCGSYNGKLVAEIPLSYETISLDNSDPYGQGWKPPGSNSTRIVINDQEGMMMANEVARECKVLFAKYERPAFEVHFIEAKEVSHGIRSLGSAKGKFDAAYSELNRQREENIRRILRQR